MTCQESPDPFAYKGGQSHSGDEFSLSSFAPSKSLLQPFEALRVSNESKASEDDGKQRRKLSTRHKSSMRQQDYSSEVELSDGQDHLLGTIEGVKGAALFPFRSKRASGSFGKTTINNKLK